MGKDLSKITTFEFLEISLGADAIGWSCRIFLRSGKAVTSSPRHLTSFWKKLPKGKGRTSLLNVCKESEPFGGVGEHTAQGQFWVAALSSLFA